MSTVSLLDDCDLEPWARGLQDDEREAAARQLHFEDRRDRICARALLRMTLARLLPVAPQDWRIGREPGGRPRVTVPEAAKSISVSVAHSRGWVACAVAAQGPVGVDVERRDRKIDLGLMLPEVCDPDERRWVESAESEDSRRSRFTALWTLKEASLKASGLGLSGGLKSPLAAACTAQGSALDWTLWQRDEGWLALVHPQAGARPTLWSPQEPGARPAAWSLSLRGCGANGWPGQIRP